MVQRTFKSFSIVLKARKVNKTAVKSCFHGKCTFLGLYRFLAPDLRSRKFGYTDFACIVTKSSRGEMVYFRARVDRVMEF